MRALLLAFVTLSFFGCQPPDDDPTPDAVPVRVVETLPMDDLKADPTLDQPIVDIGVYYAVTDDSLYNARLPLDTLVERIAYAKTIFADTGVQLNVMWLKKVEMPHEWLEIQSTEMAGTPGPDAPDNMYRRMGVQQSTLAPDAERVFENVIEPDDANDRTVYIVALNNVHMSFFEPNEDGTWTLQSAPTNALSFPSYTLEDRIPRRLRGVITIQNAFKSHKIIAHELGHKLINVSHEYRDISPQHEVDAEGGLMVYGEGTEIPASEAGRWHVERLMRSPYLYRLNPDGTRTYNPDYQEHGHYYDPIYGDYAVEM